MFVDLVPSASLSYPFWVANLVIDCFLMLDIALNFRTGFVDKYDQLHIIADPKAICKRYLTTWFALDLISSFPLEAFVPLFANDDDAYTELVKILRIFRFVRAIKILRVLRIIRALKGMTLRVFARQSAMICKCIRCLVYMLLTAHYFACFWYAVGYYTRENGKDSWIDAHIDDAEPSPFTNYSYSWYWSVGMSLLTALSVLTLSELYNGGS